MWAFHGALDRLVKSDADRQMVEGLKAAGGTATLQLNAGSWLAVICMFIAAVATAMLLFTLL